MEQRTKLVLNERYDLGRQYSAEQQDVLSLERFAVAEREITTWPGYAPTPLRSLDGLARQLGLATIRYKDEAPRFDLGSFKAIGGAYGVLRALQAEIEARSGARPGSDELFERRKQELVSTITVTCATDGNHGRAVAWAARLFGCRAVVYLPHHVTENREAAIAAHGARIVRIAGTYDDALRRVEEDARAEGRIVVSDQSYEGYEAIPADIMQGYAVSAAEALHQMEGGELPTHVFVQAGVGGFAAAICAHFWESLGERRPLFVCVEPMAADCVLQAAQSGRVVVIPGDLQTFMGCLSCGEASQLAWRILATGARAFLAIDDEYAREAMRRLAAPAASDAAIVAGESGAAGLAGLLAATGNEEIRRQLELSPDARVLLFGTEGATDDAVYRSIVRASGDEAGGVTTG